MRDILLVTLNGVQYGMWQDEVASVLKTGALHRLPLSPAWIAGITLIEERTITIADLSVCIGRGPAAGSEKRFILLLKTGKKPTGFLVSGHVETLSVSDEQVLPIPAHLRTDCISSCVLRNALLVPVIDLVFLYSKLVAGDQDALRPLLTVSPDRETPTESIRLFRIGGKVYGYRSAGSENQTITDGVMELPFAPPFVRGITLNLNQIIPVIDLSQRIMGKRTEGTGQMMMHAIGDARFALLTDENHGCLPIRSVVLAELPALARTPWIVSAALKEGAIIPLVDADFLLSGDVGETRERSLTSQYSRDSEFPDLFRKQVVDVLEFSLLGARHALPKSEVEDIILFQICCPIPETPEIVLGVVERSGALIPVLDLATVFGRMSLPNSGWKMILIRNGDFRAFVLTENVYGECRLEVAAQRDLPLALPHQVVYGCYPESGAVRLILNVASIALNFEKSLVREMLSALSPEMRQAPAEIVSFLLEDEREGAEHPEPPLEAAPATRGPSEQEKTLSIAGSFKGWEAEPREEQSERDTAHEDECDELTSREPDAAVEATPVQVTPEKTAALPPVLETIPEAEPRHAEEPAMPVADADAKAAKEERVEVKSESVRPLEQPEPEVVQSAPSVTIEIRAREGTAGKTETEQRPATEEPPSVISEPAQSKTLSLIESEPTAVSGSGPTPIPETESARAPEPTPVVTDQKPDQKAIETRPAPDIFKRPAPDQLSISYPESLTDQSRPHPETSESASSVWKRRMAYAGIAVLLALIIFFLPRPGTRKPEIPADKAAPQRVEQAGPVKKAQMPAEHSEPPLVLDIPRETPITTDVYVVVTGDTLWSISERFTGNPFNFPRIAGENRIANPDLIFPDQKIRLMKKK